jgi:hypothetical protein
MNKATNEIRELTTDELGTVAGGKITIAEFGVPGYHVWWFGNTNDGSVVIVRVLG